MTRKFAHIMRPENRIPGESQCQQVNRGVKVVYNDAEKRLESLTLDGKPLQDDGRYTICLQEFHATNSAANIGLTNEELTAIAGTTVVTTSIREVLEEYLRNHQDLNSQVEGRLEYRPA